MARAPKPPRQPRQSRADARAERFSKKKRQDHQPLLTLLKDNEARTQPRTPPSKGRDLDVKPLTDNQKLYDAAIKGCGIVFGIGPAGTGKAQPLDALLKIPGGWSRMGDILPGMTVISADGTPTTVLAVYPQGEKDIYRVTFEDGRSAECCDEHLWRVYRFDWQPADTRWRVIPLSEIRRLLAMPSAADRLYVELPKPEAVEDAELPINPYLLGALLGDGHFGRTDIRISTADEFVLDQIRETLPGGMKINHRKGYDYDLVRGDQSVLRNPLFAAVESLGLGGVGCGEKFIPDAYMTASPDQRLSLLQGLMDTDGTVCRTGSVSFCTISEKLAIQVQEIVRSLGGLAWVADKQTSYSYLGEKLQARLAYNVRIRIVEPRSLFRLPRKQSGLAETYQYADCLRLRIKSVELIGRKQAQCIAVEHDSHLYVTNDYVVTHNTWFAVQRAVEAFKRGEIERIVCTRPAVEAGNSLGFLPGDLDEKFAPYFQPVHDALVEGFGSGFTEYLIGEGKIVIKPLEFIRGSTIGNCFLIADEMQNATKAQTKLLLTRIGENATFVINGDDDQCDLAKPSDSGLRDAVNRLKHLKAVGVVEFTAADIVRSGLCQDIVIAYATKPLGLGADGNKKSPAHKPDASRYSDDNEITDSEDTGLLRMLRAG